VQELTMSKKNYTMNVSIILGISVVLMLFIFTLVAHHRGISDRIRQDQGALRATGSSAAERIKAVGQISVPSAETRREPAKNAAAAPSPGRDGK